MKMYRRALPGLLGLATAAEAADFPERPVTIANGFAAGGSSDIAARIMAPRLTVALGQPVVVENRPGAGGSLALGWLRRQPADGYTIIIADPSSLVIVPLMQPETAGYQPTRDFAPIAMVGSSPMVLVVPPDHPATDVASLVAWLAAQGGRAAYASSGTGSTTQLAAELFLQRAAARMGADLPVTHVTYRGGSPMLEAVMKNECAFGFSVLSSAAGHIRGGLLRPLAVSSTARASVLPAVPTMAEAGFTDFDLITWYMLLGPRGVAPDVVARWAGAVTETLADAGTLERLVRSGLDPSGPVAPAAVAGMLQAETARYGAIVAAAGARLRG